MTQTPQVVVDMLHWEEDADLILAWDCLENLLPPNFPERALSVAVACISALCSPSLWTVPVKDPWLRQVVAEIEEGTIGICPDDEAATSVHADSVAAIAADGTWTHRELWEATARVAWAVFQAEADIVLVIMRKSRAQVATVAGIVRAGGAYIPVDPQWPDARVQSIIDRCGSRWCITDSDIAVPDGLERIEIPHDSTVQTGEEAPGQLEALFEKIPHPEPDALAYVIFTSGSTGTPKGVALEHRHAAATIEDIAKRFGLRPNDRVLGVSALSFDLSVWDIFGLLSAGGTIVLPDDRQPRDPAMWLNLIAEYKVTIWNSAPALLEMLVDYAELNDSATQALSTLRLVMLSGDWIPVTLPQRLKAFVPDVEIYSLGGATEAAIWSIAHRIDSEDAKRGFIPYGKALAGQYFRIFDDAAQPVAIGEPGRLYIGGGQE